MSIDTNKLNETEIMCPSELSFDDQYMYNDSTDKSLLDNKYSGLTKSNTLINALKDFSVRYDLDDKKIMNSKKFVLSYDDLFTLIKFALEFQIKIYNSLNVKDYLNEISQDFINNLSYYIFSYEKIDVNKNNNSNNNDYTKNTYSNFNFNNTNNTRNKFQLNQTQTPTRSSGVKKRKNEEKKDEDKNQDISRNQRQNKNEFIKNTKSYYRVSYNKPILSPKNNKKYDKKRDDLNKSVINRSAQKRDSTFMTDFSSINLGENRKKKPNKSLEKRRTVKYNNCEGKNKKNRLSIYTACENLKGSQSRKLSCLDQKRFINKNYLNTSMEERRKEKDDKKMVYYEQSLNFGIKKKILGNSVIRPSNMANKLLQRGIKYLTEFMDLKEEEESRKKHHHQHQNY